MRTSALYVEGVAHVQRHVDGARGAQAIGIVKRLHEGLAVAQRPQDFADGVRAACLAVIRISVTQLHSDEKLNP